MSIRAQRVTEDEWFIQLTDGSSLTVTRADLIAQYQLASGNRTQKRAAVVAWLKDQVSTHLGITRLNRDNFIWEWDDTTGTFQGVTYSH